MSAGPTDLPFVVEQVAPGVTWRLRQQVLRPHQQVAEMGLPGDDDPGGAHFAAYALRGPGGIDEMIGVVSVYREDEPDGGPGIWRLRAMASAPEARRQGVGAALLARLVEHVRRSGAEPVWANARIGALEFYLAQGFVVVSPEFEIPAIGTHHRVRLTLATAH